MAEIVTLGEMAADIYRAPGDGSGGPEGGPGLGGVGFTSMPGGALGAVTAAPTTAQIDSFVAGILDYGAPRDRPDLRARSLRQRRNGEPGSASPARQARGD